MILKKYLEVKLNQNHLKIQKTADFDVFVEKSTVENIAFKNMK